MKHTPGPWRNIDNVIYTKAETHANCRALEIATVVVKEKAIPMSQLIANARLIAAAPDLLEACKKAHGLISLDTSEAANAADILNDAIKKAEGK